MSIRKLKLPLFGCTLLAAALLAPPATVPAQEVRAFRSAHDDSEQPYGLYIPRNFDRSRKYPLVVSLHGAGSNHKLNLRRVFGQGNRPGESDEKASSYFPPLPDVDFLVVTPLSRGTMGYEGLAEEDVWAAVEEVKRQFPVDEDRVYLTGLSMGGGGTWGIGLTHPDMFAAIAPVCGVSYPRFEELAENAGNLPVHLFHGDADKAVPVDTSRRWHERLLKLGFHSEYTEYPGVGHNSWDLAYKDAAIFRWFAKFKRNRFPDRVSYRTRWLKHPGAYWMNIDALEYGQLARLDARFTGQNQVEASGEHVRGLTLKLAGHPRFRPGSPVVVQVNGVRLKARPSRGGEVSLRLDGRWKSGRARTPSNAKRFGSEGPIREALSTRHIYVYGTLGADEKELARRRETAARAADWSSARFKNDVHFPVKADREVTDGDIRRSNLVLFGTARENALLERLSGKLPLALTSAAADSGKYGLAFVVPNPEQQDRLLLVNSGLPWWSRPEGARGSFSLAPPVLAPLENLGDYALFEQSLEKVHASGLFDARWQLTPAQRNALAATGLVELH